MTSSFEHGLILSETCLLKDCKKTEKACCLCLNVSLLHFPNILCCTLALFTLAVVSTPILYAFVL